MLFRQYGIRNLPDSPTHGQHWESNPRPSDLESNALSTGPHAPIIIVLFNHQKSILHLTLFCMFFFFFFLQVRLGSGNKDFHYTHWTIYPDRFSAADLEEQNLTREIPEGRNPIPPAGLFYCTNEENDCLR